MRIGKQLVGATIFVLAACSTDSTEDSSTVELFSWWVAPGEVEALDALVAVHAEEHAISVVNAAATDAETARDRLAARLEQGRPPDLFQANIGVNLTDYVGARESESRLESLESALEIDKSAFPSEVLDLASVGGQMYGVPLNVHRINVLYYSTDVLEAAGVEPPATLDELFVACEAIEATGVDCLAIPARDGWTNTLFFIENLLVTQAGPEYYLDFLSGNADPEDAEILAAATTYLEIYEHAASDSRSLGWDTAVERVSQGGAGFTVMGDWAKGFMVSRGLEPGVDFGSVPFPGSGDTFVFTSDAFVLPRGAPNRSGAVDFLSTCASKEGQIEFNLLKGSIPARTDVDPAAFDPLAQQTLEEFASGRLVPAQSALGVDAFTSPVGDAIGEMLETGDPAIAVNTMSAYYDLLKD